MNKPSILSIWNFWNICDVTPNKCTLKEIWLPETAEFNINCEASSRLQYEKDAMRAEGHQVAVLLLSRSCSHVRVKHLGLFFGVFFPRSRLHLYVIFSTWQRRVCAFVLRLLLLTFNETNVSSFNVRCVVAAAPMWPRSGSSSQKLTTKLNYRGNNCSTAKIARLRVLTWFHWAKLHEMEWFYQPFLDSCLFLPLTHTSISPPLAFSFFFFL